MNFVPERQRAEKETDKIKEVIRQSSLNFCSVETPFSIQINLKKRFLNDFQKQSQNSDPIFTTPISTQTRHDSDKVVKLKSIIKQNEEESDHKSKIIEEKSIENYNIRRKLEEKNKVVIEQQSILTEKSHEIQSLQRKIEEKNLCDENLNKKNL